MPSPTLRLTFATALVIAFAAACGGDDGGATGLFDTWRASTQDGGTEFVFDNDAGSTFDVVSGGGGIVTLAVNANGTYSLTITVLGSVVLSSTGTFVADTAAHTIVITETGSTPIPFDYVLTGNTLSIATQNLGDVEFDFDNDPMTPDEPAHLYATFARH